jgi:hypothetical protein
MADFNQTSINKTAVRELAVPLDDVTMFDGLVERFITDNPAGCVGYTNREGEAVPAIFRNREHYTAKVKFVVDDGSLNGKRVGIVSAQSPSIAAYEANATEIYNNAALETAMGGTAHRDFGSETYYCQLKCHDPTGDDYYVTFTRKTVRISSFQDDTIKDALETWADAIDELE